MALAEPDVVSQCSVPYENKDITSVPLVDDKGLMAALAAAVKFDKLQRLRARAGELRSRRTGINPNSPVSLAEKQQHSNNLANISLKLQSSSPAQHEQLLSAFTKQKDQLELLKTLLKEQELVERQRSLSAVKSAILHNQAMFSCPVGEPGTQSVTRPAFKDDLAKEVLVKS